MGQRIRDYLQRRRERPSWRKLEQQILLMVVFFSISTGLWENFRQLWLESNNLDATQISSILSLGMLAAVVAIIIVGKFVKMSQIKYLVTVALAGRMLNLLALFCLNGSGSQGTITLCIAIDIVTSYIVITSIYPLLTTVMKSNSAYSRRKLIEYLFRDVGILIGGVLIGHQLGGFLFDYNGCLLVAALFLVGAIITMYRLDLRVTERAPRQQFSAVRYILHDRIQRVYMLYVFLSSASYATVMGLKMLVFTNIFDFSATGATNSLLIIGLVADLLGILALRYFTPRNDYVTIFIKFGIRLIAFVIAFLTNNPFLCFLAFIWALLSSTAYENISDGYYINSVDNRHQLKYNTCRHVIYYLGEASGTFLCGQLYNFGLGLILGGSAFILVGQIVVCCRLIQLRRDSAERRLRPPRYIES